MISHSHYVGSESGRVKIASILLVVVAGAAVYLAVVFGGVYFRKMKFEDAIQQQLSFAGQIDDGAIMQHIQEKARDMRLPPAAQQVGLTRTTNPRSIHVAIAYEEPINLLYTKTTMPVRINVSRGF